MSRAPGLVTCGLALLVAAVPASAQFSPGARSAGMGGAGLLFATGVDAVEWNPANLAWSPGWKVSLVEVGASGLLTGTTIEDVIEIATAGGDGDPNVVTRLPANGFSLSTQVEGFSTARAASIADVPQPGSPLPSVAISAGPFAVRVRSRVLAEGRMSREVADLTVNGFNPERIQEYAVRGTGFNAVSFSEVTASYGRVFGRFFAAGIGLRYVQGHTLVQGKFFEPEVDLDEETLLVRGVAVEAAGGTGYGIDFGFALELGGGVRASMAGTNVFQRMTWDESLVAHEAVFTDEDFDNADFADLLDRFDARPLDAESVSLPVYEAARGMFDDSYFPSIVRAGVGWAGSSTTIEVVGIAVSPRGRQHNAWDQRVSAGLEQRLAFVTLRGGYAFAEDGLTAVTAGLGIGAGPIAFDVGAGRLSGDLDGVDYDGVQVTVGLAVRGGGAR